MEHRVLGMTPAAPSPPQNCCGFLTCGEAAANNKNPASRSPSLRQFFEGELIVGVNADGCSHAHGFFGNNPGIQLRVFH